MLSQTSEYALRAAAFLASDSNTPRTVDAIADRTQVPRGYLAKVLQQLARAGIVRSQRGLGGGFVLARDPDRISVLEVLNAVDPIRRIERCPLSLPEHAKQLCALHRQLDDAFAAAEASFRDSTLGDLVSPPSRRGDPPAWPPSSRRAARGRTRAAKKSRSIAKPERRTPWK